MAETLRRIEALPDIRSDKVGRIRIAIDAGTYRVEARKVADKMVSDAVRDHRILALQPA